LRRIDAFGKPREDLRSKSVLGGLITLVASTAAGLLFVAQVYVYLTGVTKHSLHLSESHSFPVPRLLHVPLNQNRQKIFLKFEVIFPHLRCWQLNVAHDNLVESNPAFARSHGYNAIQKRALSEAEYYKATGTVKSSSNPLPPSRLNDGCTISGKYSIARVGGTFSITLTQRTWAEVTSILMMGNFFSTGPDQPRRKLPQHQTYNTTHYISYITFGHPFPLMKNPLKNLVNVVDNDVGGIALANINVKLIPTKYQNFFGTDNTFQMSVTDHIVQPETMATQGSQFLPGMGVTYDFTPLAVHHVEYRDNILVFISSLVSIVGGVFVTVSLVTGCLVHSAAAVAKKVD